MHGVLSDRATGPIALTLLGMLCLTASRSAADETTPLQSAPVAEPHVILVTVDGVRWQEFFDVEPGSLAAADERPLWAAFWRDIAPSARIFGDPRVGDRAEISASRPVSLPVYHSLMAGFDTGCSNNDCPRIETETLPEALRRRLSLAQEDVAVFASWEPLGRASARRPSDIHLDVAVTTGPTAPPWSSGRWDVDTMERGLAHLRQHRPRFLYLALDDVDEWAHRGDVPAYLAAQRRSDAWLTEITAVVDELGLTEQTTMVLTTDHGRGTGSQWRSHSRIDEARRVFVAIWGAGVARPGPSRREETARHADLRPTIESLFGLTPSPCAHTTCGRAIDLTTSAP